MKYFSYILLGLICLIVVGQFLFYVLNPTLSYSELFKELAISIRIQVFFFIASVYFFIRGKKK